jgi:long-chain acyl-CoA synthetase
MNIFHHVERCAVLHPERPAVVFEGTTTTYGALADQSARIASALRAMGVRRGDRVALFLPNHPVFVVTFLATVRIGAIAVPVHPKLTPGELQSVLRDCGAETLVTTAELRAASYPAEQRLPQIRHVLIAEGDAEGDHSFSTALAAEPAAEIASIPTDAPAVIIYTSGTTGEPKGATLSHGNIDFVMRAKVECMGVTSADRLLLFLPISHCFGLNAVLNAGLAAGACVILHRRFELDEVLRSIQRDQPTMFFGVPTTFVVLLENAAAKQLHPLRYFFSAAAPLPREVEDRWKQRFGFVINQGYGLTESSPFATYNHSSRHRPGSIGTAVPGVEVAIADARSGRHLPPGERGEILLRGPNVMLGYWQRPHETAACIRDGWLHTGDVGRLDAEGYLSIEDRLKDLVIVGGTNVYPGEVEQALRSHPAVLEVAVYGRPDPVLGERVCAAVVLRGDAVAVDDLLFFCGDRLADYKIPVQVEFLAELPKGPTGKVLKRVLRERNTVVAAPERMRLAALESSQVVTSVRELENCIAGWLAATLEVEENVILRSVPFSEYGVTSLMAVELASRLCGWLGKTVPPTIAWQFSTIASLARHGFAEEHEDCTGPHTQRDAWPVELQLDGLAHLTDADAATLLHEELVRLNLTRGDQ